MSLFHLSTPETFDRCPICGAEQSHRRFFGCCSGSCMAIQAAREAYERKDETYKEQETDDWPELTIAELELIYLAELDPSVEEQATAAIYRVARELRLHNNEKWLARVRHDTDSEYFHDFAGAIAGGQDHDNDYEDYDDE